MGNPTSRFDNIAAQLRHDTLEEAIVLIADFIAELHDEQQARFLELVAHGPRPLIAEATELENAEDLLDRIHTLRNDLAKDVYVQEGVGYDPEYHAHRSFGDDGWIDEMDDLFAAADSLFHAGQFAVAAEAYRGRSLTSFTLARMASTSSRPASFGWGQLPRITCLTRCWPRSWGVLPRSFASTPTFWKRRPVAHV